MRFSFADYPLPLLLFGIAGAIGCSSRETGDPTATRTAALASEVGADIDTFINSSSPDNNNGTSPSIYTGRNGQDGMMRGLVRFALPPGLWGRVTVSRVRLILITRGTGAMEDTPPTAATLSLQAVTTGWSEGVGFGNTMMTFTVGQPCGSTGATWNQPNCVGGTAWAGGAVAGAVSGTASVPAALEAPVTFDSASGGDRMIADIQGWIDSPASSWGWRLTSSTEGTLGAQKFYSSEDAGGKGPKLVVDYSCKPPFVGVGNLCADAADAAVTDGGGGAAGAGGSSGGNGGAGGLGGAGGSSGTGGAAGAAGGGGTNGGAGGATAGSGGGAGAGGGGAGGATAGSGGGATAGSGGDAGTSGGGGSAAGSTAGSGGGATAGDGGTGGDDGSGGAAGAGDGGTSGAAGAAGRGGATGTLPKTDPGCGCMLAAHDRGAGSSLAFLLAVTSVVLTRRRYR